MTSSNVTIKSFLDSIFFRCEYHLNLEVLFHNSSKAHFHQWSVKKWKLEDYAVEAQVYFMLEMVLNVTECDDVFNISHILFLKPYVPESYTRNPNPEMESVSQRESSYIFKPHRGYSCSLLMDWCSQSPLCIHPASASFWKGTFPKCEIGNLWYTDFLSGDSQFSHSPLWSLCKLCISEILNHIRVSDCYLCSYDNSALNKCVQLSHFFLLDNWVKYKCS